MNKNEPPKGTNNNNRKTKLFEQRKKSWKQSEMYSKRKAIIPEIFNITKVRCQPKLQSNQLQPKRLQP